jgi:hypothetical protein
VDERARIVYVTWVTVVLLDPEPPTTMPRSRLLATVPFLAATVASACSLPFTKSTDERKAACDRVAASAIQEKSVSRAKELAAQASSCYADIERN